MIAKIVKLLLTRINAATAEVNGRTSIGTSAFFVGYLLFSKLKKNKKKND